MFDTIKAVFGKITSHFADIDIEQKMKYGAGALMLIGGTALALAAASDDSSNIDPEVITMDADSTDISEDVVVDDTDASTDTPDDTTADAE